RFAERYNWQVAPDALLFIPGCIPGLAMACRTLPAGSSVVVQPPVYGPFFHVPGGAGLECLRSPLGRTADGRYYQDPERLEHDLKESTRAFMLCSPHNPVGRVFTRQELEAVADVCLRHDLLILSDDIHCELIHEGYHHVPIASLAPEVERRTITLMAPSKTFNIAGLHCAVAIIPNKELRDGLMRTGAWATMGSNIMGYAAALAAYRDSNGWLSDLLAYLGGNRDLVTDCVRNQMPGVTLDPSEGTYLAWLDFSGTGLTGSMGRFFHEKARMVVGGGEGYGAEPHFVRLNYGCPRPMLEEGLRRMVAALQNAQA
ncbi:MAG: aminotransferase class I/II-fold pyridoxal phosphate-dependent enzyme, partial [Chloroflexi bacterium]|nr:aminotransferase class I/II-fold pyridoxal phosphate-dependent enzyme [Chloroflexota bacterium]